MNNIPFWGKKKKQYLRISQKKIFFKNLFIFGEFFFAFLKIIYYYLCRSCQGTTIMVICFGILCATIFKQTAMKETCN
jgi:hypothetical protein